MLLIPPHPSELMLPILPVATKTLHKFVVKVVKKMESHSLICDSCFRAVEVLLRTTLTLHHPAFTGYEFLST